MNQPKAYKGTEPYIFISYAHADSERVFPIVSALQERGYRVWYDAGIEAGTEWPEYIAEHLDGCSAFLAFISEASMNSHNCRREINFAIELRKEPMVIYLEDVKMSLGMRMQLGSLQAMFRNRHKSDGSFLDELCGSHLLDECRQANPPVQEEVPKAAPQNDFMAQQAEMFYQFGKDYYDRFSKDWKLKDESDFTKAVDWLTKAADLGHAQAMIKLGNCYYDVIGHVEFEQAAFWWRKAADLGYAAGENNIGVCYRLGNGVEKDEAEAVGWFRKAAAQNHRECEYYLGCCYETGHGVPQDVDEAIRWHKKAAEKDSWFAKNQLSNLANDQYGKGLEHYNKKEYTEAAKHFRKAAELGNRDAQNYIGVLYKNGWGVEKNAVEAVKWYRKAAEQGDRHGQCNLAGCYRYGDGVEKDREESKKWYLKAAEQGVARAQRELWYDFSGDDAAEGVRWCRKAAEQNDAEAQWLLGYSYEYGQGVPQSNSEAMNWYRKAAEQGHADAKESLQNLENLRSLFK